MPALYNETLHDKSGAFIATVSANINQLSDWHIKIIRMAFDNCPSDFYRYLINKCDDISCVEADHLLDQVFPDEPDADELN